ncbi:Uncharacterized protein TCAP_04417 [Tolypocladium capitatum]|uniref:WW domain-containing protein n=1 Tax=Tolypocladium capitatum TaxID=45235 RepID=A0A2K3QDM1_9HYPO|nr:Uncharacterized protein TCAP_04417 [Tolypocladium capitatum]
MCRRGDGQFDCSLHPRPSHCCYFNLLLLPDLEEVSGAGCACAFELQHRNRDAAVGQPATATSTEPYTNASEPEAEANPKRRRTRSGGEAMPGLPLGWESDYDGQRWFYMYRPSGHTQYHFPSEGDEFPDFIDSTAPAPVLAPEERLESQQQVRRQTSTAGAKAPAVGNGARKPDKPLMSATAQPVSFVWEAEDDGEDDGEDGEQVFQPENFMFLGPGSYVDVSPLNDDDEEAAKRVVAGGIGRRFDGGRQGVGGKGVSPVASGKTTPMVPKSELLGSPEQRESAATTSGPDAVESPPVMSEPVQPAPGSPPITDSQPTIHMIDGREVPHELPVDIQPPSPPQVFDPVGIVAEMPTEHTAVAHIELHPDPVEMGDNSILAPIETAAAGRMAELPERSSSLKVKAPQKMETKQTEQETPEPTQQQGQQGQQFQQGQPEPPKEEPQGQQWQQIQPQPVQQQQQPNGQWPQPQPQGQQQQPGYQWPQQQLGQQSQQWQQVPHGQQKQIQHGQQRVYQWFQQNGPAPTQSPEEKLEPFKIARKPTGGIGQQSAYQPYAPGQEDAAATTQPTTNRRRSNAGSLQREVSLMLGSRTDSAASFDLSSVPRVLSPGQMPPKASMGETVQQGAPQQGAAAPAIHSGAGKGTYEGKASDQELSHVPSVLQPAKNGQSRNSLQAPPQPAAPIKPQPAPVLENQASQKSQSQDALSKFPSILKPARGRGATSPREQQAPQIPPVPGPTDPSGGAQGQGRTSPQPTGHPTSMTPGPGQQPSRQSGQRVTTFHGALSSQVPPAGAQAYIPYQRPPGDQAPPQGPWQIQQPARPASAMPNIGHVQQSAPNKWLGSYQTIPPGNAHGQPSTGAPLHGQMQQLSQSNQPQVLQQQFRQIQKMQSAQPGRSQSAMGNPSSPGEASPIRSRSESQPSVYPLHTPSPMDPFRRDSSNPSIVQSVNGTAYTPSPSNGTSGPGPHVITQGGIKGSPGPPVPTKVPLQHAPGSFFPVQNPDQSSSPPQHPSNEHPVGFQATMANAAKRPLARPKPGPPPQNKSAEQQSSRPPPQPPPQGSATSTPVHLLGRIEEHDESEAVSEPNETPQGTSPRSMASSLQQSPHVQRQSELPPAQGSVGLQSLVAEALPQGPGAPRQQCRNQQTRGQPAPGQVLPQGQHPGEPPVEHAPQGRIPQGQMQSQGPMPPQGFAPPGQPFQQHAPWNVMHPSARPQGFHPGLAPPQGLSNPSGKEKETKWAKWFKTSKPSQSPLPQQQPTQYPPGKIPAQGNPNQPLPQWTAGQYFKALGWQPGQGRPPPGFQPGMPHQFAPGPQMGGPMPPGQGPTPSQRSSRRRTSDSASTSTVGSSVHLQQDIQQHQPGQAPGLGPQPVGNSQPSQPSPAAPAVLNQPGPQGPGDHHEKAHSNAGLPPPEHMQQLPRQGPKPSAGQNPMPAPPMANSNAEAPNNNSQAVTGNTKVDAGPHGQPPRDDRWAKNAAADYSGGDWGNEEGWQRR